MDAEDDALASIADQLGRVEAQLVDFHRRSAHRESVIDRLAAENQEFRNGLRRLILEPVVTDLARLHDSISREAARAGAVDPRLAKRLAGYLEELELTVERCGYRVFTAVVGEPFRPGRHVSAGTLVVGDPLLDETVAEALTAGLAEIDTGRVRRPARVRCYDYVPES